MQKHLVVALATALSVASLTIGVARAEREVLVQPGDSMQSISLRYYGDEDHVWTITRFNHLASPDLIYAGLKLILPDLPADDQNVGLASINGAQATAQPTGTATATTTAATGTPSPTATPGPPSSNIALPVLTGPGSPDAAPTPGPGQSANAADAAVPGVPIQSGLATWYGPGFVGGVTYCGDIYDQWDYTAASNTLPCGTVVVVTNQTTGGSVKVRVNDRGGFGGSLILDLSRGAFESLAPDWVGVIPVTVSLPAR
jgi:Lytic transglycolase/LysM domain